ADVDRFACSVENSCAELFPSSPEQRGLPVSRTTAVNDCRMPESHDVIRVVGARENNLKNVSIEIPKRRLTVFTGVSGSGKSSLVFATIAAESQRLINETYSVFVQGFMPTVARPGPVVPDPGAQHRLSVRDAGERLGQVGARAQRAFGGAAFAAAAAGAGLFRGTGARVLEPRSADGHLVGRRGPAGQDGAAAGFRLDRCHLRV